MATIRFFIRAGKTEERDVSVWANVFISKSEKGRRIQFQVNTDIKVPIERWDEITGRVRVGGYTKEDNNRGKKINARLDSIVELLKDGITEHERVIFTNRRHTHIKTIRHTIGSHESLLDVRIILRQALKLNATGIILVSYSVDGSVEPTLRDIEYTKKLHKTTGLLDIYLTDHVIISASAYHSITDHQTYEITPSLLQALQEA